MRRASGRARGTSSLHELVVDDGVAVEVDDHTVDDTLSVGAAWIEAQRAADSRRVSRLVDVTVQTEERLVALDHGADGARADGHDDLIAAPVHDAEVVGELRRHVESGVEWRAVEVEDRGDARLEVCSELLELLLELLFGQLARRVPRRRTGPGGREQLILAQRDDAPVRVLDQRRALDDRVNLEIVVVAGHDEAAHPGPLEPLVGDLHPAGELVQDHLGYDPLAEFDVGLEPPVLVVRAAVRVEAVEADASFELSELVVTVHDLVAAEDVCNPPLTTVDDRHKRLSGEVATEDQHVRLVEGGRIQELPPAAFRTVDVPGVVQTERYWSTSSGSSYQRTRSPTFARALQRRPFGSSSIRRRSMASRPPIRFLPSSKPGSVATHASIFSRFSVAVRHQPQSLARTCATRSSRASWSWMSAVASLRSRSLISTTCSFVSSRSAGVSVSGSSSSRSFRSSTWLISRRSRMTSSWRPFVRSRKSRRVLPWRALNSSSGS